MSKWIRYTKVTETKALVDGVHHFPDMLSAEDKNGGIIVDNIPAPEDLVSKAPHLYINPQTLHLWYEYTDKPETEPDKINAQLAQLQADNANMLYVLMMEGII